VSFGKILGVNLKVHYLFLLWLLVSTILGDALSAVVLACSVIIHELGHLLVAVNLGVGIKEVELMPFGGVAKVNKLLGSDPATEAAIALAGPANSLVLLTIGMLYSPLPWAECLLESNIMLLMVNLLPILPLDGGRILKGYLVRREGLGNGTRNLLRQTERAAWLVCLTSLVLVFAGVFSINAIVLGGFILYAAHQEKKMTPYIVMNYIGVKGGELRTSKVLPAKQLLVQPQTTVKEVLDSLTPGHFHLFTIHHHGGLVTVPEDVVWEAMLSRGIDIPFAELIKN